MTTLVWALYAEGATDWRFLPGIIRRTIEQIIAQHFYKIVDVQEPLIIELKPKLANAAECILAAAKKMRGCHALVVHADADQRTAQAAMAERIQPGFDLVRQQQAHHKDALELVPVIPVRMTEAWMLADPDALLHVVGTNLSPRDLDLPVQPHKVESVSDPKQVLREIVKQKRQRRRRKLNIGELYEPLARQISLEQLKRVPAYQQFTQDMSAALEHLKMIRA